MADVDLRRLVGSAVLVEEAELRRDGAGEREQDAKVQHEVQGRSAGTAVCGNWTTGRSLLAPWPSRSLSPSVPKAPALRTIRLTSSFQAMSPAAPLLMIDVDGVISLFGFDQTGPPEGRFVVVDGIPHLISAHAGERLARLAEASSALVHAAGRTAPRSTPAALGLPGGWAHLTFPIAPAGGLHWKLEAIEAHAGPERPVAWIDDDHDDSCARWAAERQGATLLVATDPAVGLTDEHVATLLRWARAASG